MFLKCSRPSCWLKYLALLHGLFWGEWVQKSFAEKKYPQFCAVWFPAHPVTLYPRTEPLGSSPHSHQGQGSREGVLGVWLLLDWRLLLAAERRGTWNMSTWGKEFSQDFNTYGLMLPCCPPFPESPEVATVQSPPSGHLYLPEEGAGGTRA